MTKIIALGALLFISGIVCLSNMSNDAVQPLMNLVRQAFQPTPTSAN